MHFYFTASAELEHYPGDRFGLNTTGQPGKYAPNVGLSPLEPS